MPTMADVTIKNQAGSDVTAVAVVASGGDRSPARWVVASAVPSGMRPSFEMTSRWNTARTARHVETKINCPSVYTNTTTGLIEARGSILVVMSCITPQNVTQADIDASVAYATSFIRATLPVSCYAAGYSPT